MNVHGNCLVQAYPGMGGGAKTRFSGGSCWTEIFPPKIVDFINVILLLGTLPRFRKRLPMDFIFDQTKRKNSGGLTPP